MRELRFYKLLSTKWPRATLRSAIAWILWMMLLLPTICFAQLAPSHFALDVSTLQSVCALDSAGFAMQKADPVADSTILHMDFSQRIPAAYLRNIPIAEAGRPIYLRFALKNGSDSAQSVYFFPGLYCNQMVLFKLATNGPKQNLQAIKNIAGKGMLEGVQLISLSPKENTWVFARLDFKPSTVNHLSPCLIKGDFIDYFSNHVSTKSDGIGLFNYLSVGILMMMFFYSFTVFLQNYHVDFLYYAAYAACMALYIFLESYLYTSTKPLAYLFEGFLDYIILMIGICFYLLFFRKFLNTKLDHPLLERLFSLSTWAILGSMLLFSLMYLFRASFFAIELTENITKQFLIVAGVVFVYYGMRKKDALMNYVVTGQILLTLFAFVALMLRIYSHKIPRSPDNILTDHVFYFEIGVVLQMIFFMAGLSYKNKQDLIERVKERERLKLDNERKEFEKQVVILEAQQQERNRISADMHDELGSGITAIRLMSEIVKAKMKENTIPEIEKISNSANELINKMNAIIWTMVSSNDSVESLVAYLRAYAVEFFENTPIECYFHAPADFPSHDLSGEKRRNLFLCVKELLNNVVKHSQATRVTIDVWVQDKLIIDVSDNGIGIHWDNARKFGNGIQNMKKRIESISGHFRMENHLGTRTVIELQL
jgi:signal transduction histidine kinase